MHGGTKASDIIRKVKKAEEIAKKNAKLIQENEELAPYKHMDTVLFFDEANTTEAIGIIKEITCDKSLLGRPIELHEKLKMVAACNPYRKYVTNYFCPALISGYFFLFIVIKTITIAKKRCSLHISLTLLYKENESQMFLGLLVVT